MYIDRIKEAVRYLKQVHLEGRLFDYSTWGSTGYYCGTVACAGGWLTQNKIFQEQGLSVCPFGQSVTKDLTPFFEGARSYEALAKFFDITLRESYDIFIGAANKIEQKCGKMYYSDQITAYHIAKLLEDLLPFEVDAVECFSAKTMEMESP